MPLRVEETVLVVLVRETVYVPLTFVSMVVVENAALEPFTVTPLFVTTLVVTLPMVIGLLPEVVSVPE